MLTSATVEPLLILPVWFFLDWSSAENPYHHKENTAKHLD